MAAASHLRIRVDLGSVLWFEPGRAICTALAADPLATLASGCLLAAFGADRAKAVLKSLALHGHLASQIGTAEPGSGVCDAGGGPLEWPGRDEVARLLSGKTEGPRSMS
jgi:hydrogenase maturation factor